MRKPPLIAYLIGNAFVVLPLGLGFFSFGWLGVSQADNFFGLLAILCAVVGFFATRAYARVRRYEDWQRDWNALEGRQK